MDDFEVIKDPKVDQFYQDSLAAGIAFDEMMRSNGWKYVKAIIDATIKTFTNKALLQGFKSMEDYAFERGVVEGQRKILTEIESAMKVLREDQKRARGDIGTAGANTSTES
jgi:hypothetical protein